jgi:hypothetical protein
MSAYGTKRTSTRRRLTSAIEGKADNTRRRKDVWK